MSIQIKIKTFALVALGTVLVTAQTVRAQQTFTGSVLGLEVEGDRCTITLTSEGQTTTEVTDAATCEQVLVGNRIQLTREVTQLAVLPSPETGTITRLEAGDRTCYVGLTDAESNTFVQLADFSICNQDLEGATVRLTYGSANILPYSCRGDVDCGRSEAATIITEAEVIDRPVAANQPTVSSLPDGNYRYWNGSPTDGIVSDDDLLASGERTLVVRFKKQGNNFTGIFGYVNDETICVQGQINGDTVTGISVQAAPGAVPISTGETFESFNASDRLKLRRGRQVGSRQEANIVRYDSTLLNLEGLNRINAGPSVPPIRC